MRRRPALLWPRLVRFRGRRESLARLVAARTNGLHCCQAGEGLILFCFLSAIDSCFQSAAVFDERQLPPPPADPRRSHSNGKAALPRAVCERIESGFPKGRNRDPLPWEVDHDDEAATC